MTIKSYQVPALVELVLSRINKAIKAIKELPEMSYNKNKLLAETSANGRLLITQRK